MISIHTTFLGLTVDAFCYHDSTSGWLIDDLKVSSEGHDMWEHLTRTTQLKLAEHVREEARNKHYKYS